jgi:hypothetical protein
VRRVAFEHRVTSTEELFQALASGELADEHDERALDAPHASMSLA